ncbi:DUF4249 domain-containing protein [Mucilaginibacter sp. L3T2-6]|nr:DUF4249 domain-containing protein [Mucilaginibacter sp. L3T2-6]MDO3645075.1 DUF4249 domain-containing protein [Mucilaginibacter sp. L3T2-6]
MACKKPYNPTVIDSAKSYLVVEGVINTKDTTTIKLSRTVSLSSKIISNPVEANVTVESDAGKNYGLVEKSPGIYILTGVTLSDGPKYRLHIVTKDNNEYRSDYVQVKNAPPIDSIGFNLTAKGIQIYSNAHDVTNNTHYYRFEYVETWKFHSLYNSSWISDGSDIVRRTADQQVYYCYKSNNSSSITLGSTAKLTHDVLYQTPIIGIESTSEKIETKYSILLKQYALTAEAYKFWESLRKNTEQLGSIFDAEPTQLAGNIHNLNANSDIVIGYISAGSVATKRVFIANEQLPATFLVSYPYECQLDTFWYSNPHANGHNDVVEALVPKIELAAFDFGPDPPAKPLGFMGASPYCVDCTLRGSKKQPDFWK